MANNLTKKCLLVLTFDNTIIENGMVFTNNNSHIIANLMHMNISIDELKEKSVPFFHGRISIFRFGELVFYYLLDKHSSNDLLCAVREGIDYSSKFDINLPEALIFPDSQKENIQIPHIELKLVDSEEI